MKKRIQWPLLVIILLIAFDAHAKTAGEIFEAVSANVVVIQAYDATGKALRFGSGVVLPNGVVATNFHVIEGATQLKVFHQQANYTATLLHSDRDRDVCTLTVRGLKVPSILMGSSNRLKVGSRIYAIGAPKGLVLTLSEGIISSLRPVKGGQYLQITAPISPGSSGGGLFDEEGRLVGLTTFYMTDGQQLNFAIPVEWIGELPERHKKDHKETETYTNWLNKAETLYFKKDWAGLLTHSIRRIEASPQDAVAWFFMGIAYNSSGQISQAIDAYQQALRINPEYVEVWYNLGMTYKQSNETAKAIQAYDQAIRINPEYAKAYNNRGNVYADDLGDQNRAIKDFDKAIEIDPEYELAYYNRGNAYSTLSDHNQAIQDYDNAIRINPKFAAAFFNMGNSHRQLGNNHRSIRNYNRAIEIESTDSRYYNNRGLIYLRLDDHSLAIKDFSSAIALNPKHANAYMNRGGAYIDLGNQNQAIKDFKVAARLGLKAAQEYLRGEGITW